MTDKASVPSFPILEIKAFVDATTVVLMGPHVEDLSNGDELYILGIGDTTIPGTAVRLVAPKATLEVTFVAQVYALARPPLEKVEIANPLAGFTAAADLFGSATRSVVRREPLTSDESQFLGNPGRKAVKVGDPVIKIHDLAEYLTWRGRPEQQGTASAQS